MARYICKCGRVVNKSTNADNTGNRNTDGCEGCPYLLPWGPFAYKPGDGYVMDVKGKECRMSPSIDYASTYYGSADDKCTLRIISLDLDFLEEMQVWINEHAEGQLSGGFSRDTIRGTDYSQAGRYCWSIYCSQNKKGMAAKAALIQRFFDSGHRRLDMTPEEEKSYILAAIEAGKAACQRKKESMKQEYIISENIRNECLYAYANSKFWVYDKHTKKWYISDFCREQYEKAHNQMPQLFPEDFLADSLDYTQMDDYELPSPVLNALLVAVSTGKREKAPFEVAGDPPTDAAADASPCAPGASDALPLPSQNADADAGQGVGDNAANPTQAAPASPAGAGAATQSLSAAAPASLAADPAPKFDYSGMDIATVDTLHWAERAIRDARRKCIADVAEAVYIVHDQLIRNSDDHNLSDAEGVVRNSDNSKHGNRGEQAFVNWCRFMGISKTTAYQLLQVHNLLSGATPEELRVLENSGTSLLYVASRPSAEPEAVEALKQEQVKTLKEFRALEAQIKAERQARERAEQRLADAQHAHQAERESTSAMLREEQQRRQAAEERRIAAEKDKADARQQAKEAQARGKQDAALVEKLQDILLQRDNKLAEQEAQLGRISFSLEDAGRRIQEQADTIQELEAELDQKDEVIRQQGRQPLEAVAVVDQDEVQRQARLLAEQSLPPVCNLLTLLQSSIQQAWDLSGLAGRQAADEEDESACVLLRQYLLSLLAEVADIAGWEEKT